MASGSKRKAPATKNKPRKRAPKEQKLVAGAVDQQRQNNGGGRDANGKFTKGNEAGWKFGQSGNPKGRPRGLVISEVYRRMLGENVPNDPDGRTYADLIAEVVVKNAARGNLFAVKELTDRTEGKPRQAIEVTTVEPNDVRIREVDVIVNSLERAAIGHGERVTPAQLAARLLAQVEGREAVGIRSRFTRGDILAYCQAKGHSV